MREAPTPAPWWGGIDGDHVDLARARCVLVDEPDCDEAHGATVGDRDPDVVLRVRAGGSDGAGLGGAPVREQQAVDPWPEHRLEACEHRRPRLEREGHHSLEVGVVEPADDRGHGPKLAGPVGSHAQDEPATSGRTQGAVAPRAVGASAELRPLKVYSKRRISDYFGSGQRWSGTTPSSSSATSRTAAMAGTTVFTT